MAPSCRDERGSLPLAMLLALVGFSLTALMTPLVLREVSTARTGMARTHALQAAEAGLHAALGQIRASDGDIAALPCGPFTGKLSVASDTRYQVAIDYLDVDPLGNVSTSYLTSQAGSDPWVTTHRVSCQAGSRGTTVTPRYALLRAVGTDVPTGTITTVPNRAMYATHQLATATANIPGGAIRVRGTDLCFDAGSPYPTADTLVTVQPCAGDAAQIWAYRPDLTIELVSSSPTTPMCIDAGSPHALDAPVTVQPCGPTTKVQQRWSYNPWSNFEGTSDDSTLDGFCLNVQNPVAGSQLVLGSRTTSTCAKSSDDKQGFDLEPTVGAGAAPSTADGHIQLVNYHQFSRCLDVPKADPTGYRYVMAWSCKQTPDGNVEWNQMWDLPTPAAGAATAGGRITTTCNNTPETTWKCTNGVDYCLRSPLTAAPGTSVAAVPCASGGSGLNWTRYDGNAAHDQRYQIADENCLCMTVLDNAELDPEGFSKIVVRPCDGSTAQMWNAPPNTNAGQPLRDIGER